MPDTTSNTSAAATTIVVTSVKRMTAFRLSTLLKRSPRLLAGAEAAVDDERRPGNECRIVARQVSSGGRDFFRLSHPIQRVRGGELTIGLFGIRILTEPRRKERRLDAAGTDAIDADAVER